MTPEQQFQHAIKVRNRSYGPTEGTCVSPYLDVEIFEDNKEFIKASKDDVNMLYRVLQSSTVKRGVRRKVAKRSLNALGGVSGMCGVLNGDKELVELSQCLKFAESLEELCHAEHEIKRKTALEKKKKLEERKQKRAAALLKKTENFRKVYDVVLKKLGRQDVLKKHARILTGPQLKAVAFVQCDGTSLRGKVGEMREQLQSLLPGDEGTPEFPEYATQDDLCDSVSAEENDSPSDSDDEPHVSILY